MRIGVTISIRCKHFIIWFIANEIYLFPVYNPVENTKLKIIKALLLLGIKIYFCRLKLKTLWPIKNIRM